MPIYNTNRFWNYINGEHIEIINRVKEYLTRKDYDFVEKKYTTSVYYNVVSDFTIEGERFVNLRFPAGLTKYLLSKISLKLVDSPKDFIMCNEDEIMNMANEIKSINSDFEIRDYQLEAVETSLKTFASLIQSTTGSGKGQPVSLEIPTPNGKKKFGELAVGDYVFDSKGKTTRIVGVFPQGVKDVYEVEFRSGRKTLCDDAHLWTFVNRSKNKTTISTKDLLNKKLYRENKGKRYYNYNVLEQPIVEYEEKSLPIHPYLLGLIASTVSCIDNQICMRNLEKDIVEKIKSSLGNSCCIEEYFLNNDNLNITIKQVNEENKIFINKIKDLGVTQKSIDRSIPELYLQGSVDQRLDLLRGIMDIHGCCQKRKNHSSVKFCSTSLKLINDVKQLVFSLGGSCFERKVSNHRKNTYYTIAIQMNICPFYTKRKADNWTPYKTLDYLKSIELIKQEETVCIKVDSEDELYLTSDYIITHNTSIMSLTTRLLKDKKTLITNGNNFILQQIYDRLVSFGETDISWNPSSEPDYSKRVVLINTSTSDSRLNKQDEKYIEFLKQVQIWQIDECAHFQSLTNFEPIFYMDHDKLEHIIGYTATPFRNYKNPYNNEQDFTLIALLNEPSFVYEMKNTIADNNIAQPYCYFIKYPNKAAYLPPNLEDNYYMQYRANITYNKARNRAGVEMLKFLNKNNIKTLAYFNNIKPGQAIMKQLKEEGVDSIFICGSETIHEWKMSKKGKLKLETRDGNIDDVKAALNGEYNIIFGSSVMAEGVDISTFQAAVLFSGGKSPISILQVSGRASRKKEVNNISFMIDFKDTDGYYVFTNQYKKRRQLMIDSGVRIIDDVHEFIKMIEDLNKK
jgi:superfamily II DNA or RNA helicase